MNELVQLCPSPDVKEPSGQAVGCMCFLVVVVNDGNQVSNRLPIYFRSQANPPIRLLAQRRTCVRNRHEFCGAPKPDVLCVGAIAQVQMVGHTIDSPHQNQRYPHVVRHNALQRFFINSRWKPARSVAIASPDGALTELSSPQPDRQSYDLDQQVLV